MLTKPGGAWSNATSVTPLSAYMQMYAAIRKELEEGGRTFIICPLVEESSSEVMTDVKAAEEEHRRLQQDGVLGDVRCGLLHGRMSSEDKFAALQAFATGQTPVLISTTVVEVSISDCPEATHAINRLDISYSATNT